MLNILLPLASTKTDPDPKQDQFLNLQVMEKSNNEILNSLSKDIYRVNLLLWVLTIIGLFSFLGLILKLSEKANLLSNILIISGCSTIAFSSISCVLSVFILKDMNFLDEVQPFLIYLNIILMLILVILTISFGVKILKSFLIELKNQKIKKASNKEKSETKEVKRVKKTDSADDKNTPVKKPIKFRMDDWDNKRTKTTEFSEKKDLDKEVNRKQEEINKEKIEKTSDEENKSLESEKQVLEKNSISDPFPKETKKTEEVKEKKDAEISDSFEKALESAIKKKKVNTEQKPDETTSKKIERKTISTSKDELKKEISKEIEKNRQIGVEKFNVKCPKCGSIFEAEKQTDGITKIKCPKCGKEGIIK